MQNILDGGADGRELLVDAIGALLHRGNGCQRFAPIVVALYRVHGAARPPNERVLEFGVFAKAARVAQEWILGGFYNGNMSLACVDKMTRDLFLQLKMGRELT